MRRIEPTRGAGITARRGGALLALCALAALGCAPMQTIPLHVAPRPVQLYVDGEEVPGDAPAEISLRADQPHILFFRKAGHRAEQVVLRTEQGPDGPRLQPDAVRVTLGTEQPKGRRLEVELDEPDRSGAPDDRSSTPAE